MSKRIYSLEEVKEQIEWHSARVKLLQDRIANGECTEPMMPEGEWRPKADDPSVVEWWGTSELLREMDEQNASISHEVEEKDEPKDR